MLKGVTSLGSKLGEILGQTMRTQSSSLQAVLQKIMPEMAVQHVLTGLKPVYYPQSSITKDIPLLIL